MAGAGPLPAGCWWGRRGVACGWGSGGPFRLLAGTGAGLGLAGLQLSFQHLAKCRLNSMLLPPCLPGRLSAGGDQHPHPGAPALLQLHRCVSVRLPKGGWLLARGQPVTVDGGSCSCWMGVLFGCRSFTKLRMLQVFGTWVSSPIVVARAACQYCLDWVPSMCQAGGSRLTATSRCTARWGCSSSPRPRWSGFSGGVT